MDAHRSVILATVVGVNDGNVLYPCCIQCYAKMVHNLHMDKWECVRCNMRCAEAELTWRYRLSLCVADSSATCHLSLFGGTLIQHFGCSGKDFHRFIVSQYGDKQGTGEIILQAAQAALVGKSFIFCLKTNTPLHQAPTADTASTHSLPSTSRSLCLADLLESQSTSSNSWDGKLSDFVAVQMIQTGSQGEVSQQGTVLGVLKAMEREREQNASSFSGHVTKSVRPTSRLQSQISSHGRSASSHTGNCKGTVIQQNHRIRASLIHGPSRMSTQACEDHDDHCECSQGISPSGHSSFGTSLSQESSVGQSSLRFSCQSSMDKEFSSQTDLSSTESRSEESVSDSQSIFKRGDAAREVITENTVDFDQSAAAPTSGRRTGMKTGRRKNKTRTKKRIPRLQLKCDTARRESKTCSSLRKQCADKVPTDKRRMNADTSAGNDSSGFESTLPVLGQDTNCQDWDKHFPSQKPDLKLPYRECGMNEDTAVGDHMSGCSGFESTVPVLSQSSMDVNHHDQNKHSQSKQADLNLPNIKESFSSSLNDSSFLLGAMQADTCSPFVDVCVAAGSPPVEITASLVTRLFCDEAVHCASDNLRQADPSSSKAGQADPTLSIPTNDDMSRAIQKDDGHCVDLPHSEDLSLFLDMMASYPADINQIPFETLRHASLQEKTIACNRHVSNSELVQLGGSTVCRKNLSCSYALSNSSGILSESHHASQTGHGTSTPNCRSRSLTLEGIAGVTARKKNYEMKVSTDLLPEDQFHDSTVLLDDWHEAFTLEQKSGLSYNQLSSCKTLQSCLEQAQQKSVNALSEKFCCNRGEALPSDHMLKQHSHRCKLGRTLTHTVHERHHMAHTEEEHSVLLMPESEDLNAFLNKMGNCNCCAECVSRNLRSDHADKACQQPVLEVMKFPVCSSSRSCTLPVPQNSHLADFTNNVQTLDVLALEEESHAQIPQKSPPIVAEVKMRTRNEEKELKVMTSRLVGSKKRIFVSHNSDEQAPSEDLILKNCETSDRKLQCLKYSGSEEGLPGAGQAMSDSVLDGSVDLFVSHEATADPAGNANTPCTDKLTRTCENSFSCLLTPVSKNLSHSCSSMGISADLRMKLKKERLSKACEQPGQWQKNECSSQEANSISLRDSILGNAHNHSASAQKDGLNQVFLSSSPEALQPKKVRFSCKRRVSSVGAMDARLERYMSPQQNAGQWQPRTPTRTSHTSKSCMKQTVPPARTHLQLSSETPRNTITFRSQIRSPLSPITDLYNTKGDSLLSHCSLTKKQQYSTPKLHHGRVSLFGHKMKYPEVSQLGLDTEAERQSQYPFSSQCDYSGSQDLFSPLKDIVLLPAQGQQAGTEDVGCNVLSGKDRMQTAGDLIPDVRMSVEENKSQSLFDNSDELFDNSEVTMWSCENTCDLGARQKQHCGSCTPKTTESYADSARTDEGNLKKHVVPSTHSLRHSVIPNFSASYLFSPDLFSP